MRRILCTLAALFILLQPLATPTYAQPDRQCFPETSFCIEGRIRQFWTQNGGLAVFGLPITPQQPEVAQGQPLQVQWFERARLELHPENQAPYDVLLGLLGSDRLAQQGRNAASFPPSAPQPGCRFFAETGHNLCEPILAVWRASGIELDGLAGSTEAENLALFGLPLSDMTTETLADGKAYQVQWFERARFELHPENQPPYQVLLGLLGTEVRSAGGAPQPVPPVAPTNPPPATPAAPSFNNCQADPTADQAPNAPVQIVGVDKRAEVVTILNVGTESVTLDGWRICSIKGGQLHATLSGTLAPGEQRAVASQAGGNIWNNSERDDAALYDAEGRLISYRVDR